MKHRKTEKNNVINVISAHNILTTSLFLAEAKKTFLNEKKKLNKIINKNTFFFSF